MHVVGVFVIVVIRVIIPKHYSVEIRANIPVNLESVCSCMCFLFMCMFIDCNASKCILALLPTATFTPTASRTMWKMRIEMHSKVTHSLSIFIMISNVWIRLLYCVPSSSVWRDISRHVYKQPSELIRPFSVALLSERNLHKENPFPSENDRMLRSTANRHRDMRDDDIIFAAYCGVHDYECVCVWGGSFNTARLSVCSICVLRADNR